MSKQFNYTNYVDKLVPILKEIENWESSSAKKLARLVKKHTKENGDVFSKDELIKGYRELAGSRGLESFTNEVIKHIRMKPVRTVSGVAPVTVLTKPFPCPGKCIFCPNDVRMPKSYLADEPGAQRAERNWFDPYLQTYTRLEALHNIGHSVDKVELIVLGGTWSYYPENYQIWFIKECFRALNDFGQTDDRPEILERYQVMQAKLEEMQLHAPSSDPDENKRRTQAKEVKGEDLSKSYNETVSEMYVAPEKQGGFHEYQQATWEELEAEQQQNETSDCRSVGLVVETRPDNISQEEIIRQRRLGCTKTQIGLQSLQDEVLEKNNRGHDVAASRRAMNLLRQAGFKIHAHWMANLYGSSVEKDITDFKQLFNDPDFHPDELKIYPCSLISSAELMQYYQKGLWEPYTHDELLEVLTACLLNTPEYCRLTRVIRDIPSTDIVAGNKKTNFRQITEDSLAKLGQKSVDIRAREIRGAQFDPDDLVLEEVRYQTSVSDEIFLQFVVPASKVAEPQGTEKPQVTPLSKTEKKDRTKIVGFLRLSLPTEDNFFDELQNAAIIREIHIYGQVVGIGQKAGDKAQHLGLGTKLINKAKELSTKAGYERLSVISAIGTKEYYRKKGFTDGQLYQHMAL